MKRFIFVIHIDDISESFIYIKYYPNIHLKSFLKEIITNFIIY